MSTTNLSHAEAVTIQQVVDLSTYVHRGRLLPAGKDAFVFLSQEAIRLELSVGDIVFEQFNSPRAFYEVVELKSTTLDRHTGVYHPKYKYFLRITVRRITDADELAELNAEQDTLNQLPF